MPGSESVDTQHPAPAPQRPAYSPLWSFSTPPRRVRRIRGRRDLWGTRLFLTGHFAAALLVPCVYIWLLLCALAARPIPGTVTGGHTDEAKGGDHYMLHFEYRLGNDLLQASERVSPDLYHTYTATTGPEATRTPITLYAFSLGPWHHARISPHADWCPIAFLTLWLAFWETACLPFAYQLWIEPLRQRRLYRWGAIAPGRILAKGNPPPAGNRQVLPRCRLTCQFTDAFGQTHVAEAPVSPKAWEDAKEGQSVTIFYWPTNPRRCGVYEFDDFAVSLPATTI